MTLLRCAGVHRLLLVLRHVLFPGPCRHADHDEISSAGATPVQLGSLGEGALLTPHHLCLCLSSLQVLAPKVYAVTVMLWRSTAHVCCSCVDVFKTNMGHCLQDRTWLSLIGFTSGILVSVANVLQFLGGQAAGKPSLPVPYAGKSSVMSPAGNCRRSLLLDLLYCDYFQLGVQTRTCETLSSGHSVSVKQDCTPLDMCRAKVYFCRPLLPATVLFQPAGVHGTHTENDNSILTALHVLVCRVCGV